MKPAGRVGDIAFCPSDSHGCPGCAHPVQGPAIQGSPNVLINDLPALRVGDPGIHAACCGGNKWRAKEGASTVIVNNKRLFRQGDATKHCGGTGKLMMGSANVLVDDQSPEKSTIVPHHIELRITHVDGTLIDDISAQLLSQLMLLESPDEDGFIRLDGIEPGEVEVAFSQTTIHSSEEYKDRR